MRRLNVFFETSNAAFLILGALAPLCFFFFQALRPEAVAVLLNSSVQTAMLNSLALACATAFASTALAFFFSWVLWRYRWPIRLRRFLELTLKVPYLIPPFFFAMGWIALAAPQVGYFNQLTGASFNGLYGMTGAFMVLTFWSTALAMIQLQVFFSHFAGHLEDAAVLCGASPIRAFFSITLPLARPHLMSCMAVVGLNALASFGVPAMLALPARSYTLTTKIYQSIKSSSDFSEAAILCLALLILTMLILGLQYAVTKRTKASAMVSGKASRPAQLSANFAAKLAFVGIACFCIVACVLPCGAVFLQSFLRDRADITSLSLEKYVYVFTQIPDGLLALQNSLITASAATALATVLGLFAAYGSVKLKTWRSRGLVEFWNLSYALPGTVIALSLLLFYPRTLSGTLAILSLAYLVKYAAFSLRILAPSLGGIAQELEEAAWMSGASSVQTFYRIIVPLLKPALAASLLLAMVPMLSELTMSIFLVGTGTETLGALIYRLQEYADPGAASVLAVTIACATLVLNFILRKLSKGGFGI